MISADLLPQILETARWLIVRLFIFMGFLSLFPTILVLLLEPIIIAMRQMNSRSPSSSAATSRATTPSSSRNPSRSPSLSRKRTPQPPSASASPMLRDIGSKRLSSSVSVPAVVVNPASVSNIVEGLGVTHRKVNPGALVASLPSSPQLASF